MKKHLRFALMGLLLVGVVPSCTFPGSGGGGDAILPIDYPPKRGGGDLLSRAFYITAYPGTTLSTVTLYFCATTVDSYIIRLQAYDSAFNGTLIGQQSAGFSGSTSTSDIGGLVRTSFNFGNVAVTKGHAVAFKMSLVSGGTGTVYFCNKGVVEGTPIVQETEDSIPPLSTKRFGQTWPIAIRVEGDN